MRHIPLAFAPNVENRYRKGMSAPIIEDLKKAIALLPNDEKLTLATWLNSAVIREGLLAADDQISRGEGSEYDEQTLRQLFHDTEASALQLLKQRTAKR